MSGVGLCIVGLILIAVVREVKGTIAVSRLPGPQPDPEHLIAAIDVEELDILNEIRSLQGRRPVVFTRQYPALRVAPPVSRKKMKATRQRKPVSTFAGIPGPIVPVCQRCPICRHESILHVMPNAMKASCVHCGILNLDVATAQMKAELGQVRWS
jgi:hypothetical protein